MIMAALWRYVVLAVCAVRNLLSQIQVLLQNWSLSVSLARESSFSANKITMEKDLANGSPMQGEEFCLESLSKCNPNKLQSGLSMCSWRLNVFPLLTKSRRCVTCFVVMSGSNSGLEDDPQWAFRNTTRFQTFPQVLLHVLDLNCSGDLYVMLIWNI